MTSENELDPKPGFPLDPPSVCAIKRVAGQYVVLSEARAPNGAPDFSSVPGAPRFHDTIERAEDDVRALLFHFPDDRFAIVRLLGTGRMEHAAPEAAARAYFTA